MKYRPLPPPPRPPRDRKSRHPYETQDKFDHDGGGEKMIPATLEELAFEASERILPTTLEDISRISSQDVEEIEEVERATQTDPLPDDFCCEEFEISDDMKVLEPSFPPRSKTLEDILKEEQQAELDRAKQIADEECLTKGIQKFREANQRSYSERSKGSTADRPKTPSSRPITPSAIVVEKKVLLSTIETDAKLIVRPVDEQSNVPRIDSLEDDSDIRYIEETVDTEDERIVNEAIRRYKLLEEDLREPSPVPEETIHHSKQPSPTPPPRESRTKREEEKPPTIPPKPTAEALEIREEDIFEEELPLPPPRRRSSASESITSPAQSTIVTEMDTIQEQRILTAASDPPLEILPGGRLHITELEVENLSVNALQAGRILVSDLQAISINSQDLDCKSGNLVVKGIELPPGFIEELVDRVRTSEREANQQQQILQQEQQQSQQSETSTEKPAELKEKTVSSPKEEPDPPARPPPPQSLYPSDYAPYSIPPPSFYQLRNYSDEPEHLLPPHSPTSPRRRRPHRKRDESTSEEDYQRDQRRSRHGTRSPEPSITELSGQLIRACSSAVGRTSSRIINAIRSRNKDDTSRQDINIGLILLIVIVAVLMMLGMGADRAVHHHHWDYFNPPDNDARK